MDIFELFSTYHKDGDIWHFRCLKGLWKTESLDRTDAENMGRYHFFVGLMAGNYLELSQIKHELKIRVKL